MSNVKAGELAYIVRPWGRHDDIGRPVTVVRAAVFGECIEMRNGDRSRVDDHLTAWLCEANGDRFPKFIADICLRRLGGDLTGDDEPVAVAVVAGAAFKLIG